jgi:hypothetical protein
VDAQGNRTLWTAAVPDSDVTVNFGAGTAELNVQNLAAEDYFNLPNASIPGTEVDATVSLDVVWSGLISRRVSVKDATNGFTGDYVEENVGNAVTINWSASNSLGFSFTANPGNLSSSVAEAGPFAELGKERNGILFPQGGSAARADLAHVSAMLPLLSSLAAFPSLSIDPTPPASNPALPGRNSGLDAQPLAAGSLKGGIASAAAAQPGGAETGLDADATIAFFAELGRSKGDSLSG